MITEAYGKSSVLRKVSSTRLLQQNRVCWKSPRVKRVKLQAVSRRIEHWPWSGKMKKKPSALIVLKTNMSVEYKIVRPVTWQLINAHVDTQTRSIRVTQRLWVCEVQIKWWFTDDVIIRKPHTQTGRVTDRQRGLQKQVCVNNGKCKRNVVEKMNTRNTSGTEWEKTGFFCICNPVVRKTQLVHKKGYSYN